MNQIFEWISKLISSFKFWVVVPPWDFGIRVRLGRRGVGMAPGAHWRIPFVDEVLLVNTRLRITVTPTTTINSTETGKCKVLSATVAYRIQDPLLAVMSFATPVVAVQTMAQAQLASGVTAAEALSALQAYFGARGVVIESMQLVVSVETQSIRVLQSEWHASDENHYVNTPANSLSDPRY